MRSMARWCAICGPASRRWAGMRAADLAPLGLGGIAESTYDVFVGCFGTRCRSAGADGAARRALGDRRAAITSSSPAASTRTPPSRRASRSREKLAASGRTPDDIAEITVETHPRGLTLTEVEPPTVLSAKFSMPHALGGRGGAPAPAGRARSRRDTLDDPAIARLRQAVRLQPYAPIAPWPNDRPGRVTWRLADGAVVDASGRERARRRRPAVLDRRTARQDRRTDASRRFPRCPACLRALDRRSDTRWPRRRGAIVVDADDQATEKPAWKPDVDVLVVGAGACGLAAAIAAHDAGAQLSRSSRSSTGRAATPRSRPVRCRRPARASSARPASTIRPSGSSPICCAPAGRPTVPICCGAWSRPRPRRSSGWSTPSARAWRW